MPQDTIKTQKTRSFSQEGREFTAKYLLGEEPDRGGTRYFLKATLKESGDTQEGEEYTIQIRLSCLASDVATRIFHTIADAKDPVFPVHIPDIVLDSVTRELASGVTQTPKAP